ncbi:MAG: ABC transporter permease [Acidimicrobiia bacterium]|nr:ABC transporter permease [Acidimicrobiia bacterium]
MTAADGTSEGLRPLDERGWRSGLSSLMGAGFGSWWKTKEWWIHSLMWTAIINGSLAVAIWGEAPDELDVFTLYGVMTMFAAIAVAILMQEAIVGEKRSGTAAWIHSKPVSRSAFMLSKLVPNAVGMLATMIAIPSVVLLVQMELGGIDVSVSRFILGASVAGLNLMFYLTLTLMLGTIFNTAGPVIAIPLAIAFGQQLISALPGLGEILPWGLVVASGEADSSVIGALIAGEPIPAPGAVVLTFLACLAFTGVAFLKWNRTEL